jgi:hypothetical protein
MEEKKDGIGFGIASLVLGICSLLLFCTCVNLLLAILAIVFGIIQIVGYKKRGLAVGGIVTAALSIVLFVILCVLLWQGMFINGEYYYDLPYAEFF